MKGRRLSPRKPRSRIQCSSSRTPSAPRRMSIPANGRKRSGWRPAIAATDSLLTKVDSAVEASSKPVISVLWMPAASCEARIAASSRTRVRAMRLETTRRSPRGRRTRADSRAWRAESAPRHAPRSPARARSAPTCRSRAPRRRRRPSGSHAHAGRWLGGRRAGQEERGEDGRRDLEAETGDRVGRSGPVERHPAEAREREARGQEPQRDQGRTPERRPQRHPPGRARRCAVWSPPYMARSSVLPVGDWDATPAAPARKPGSKKHQTP